MKNFFSTVAIVIFIILFVVVGSSCNHSSFSKNRPMVEKIEGGWIATNPEDLINYRRSVARDIRNSSVILMTPDGSFGSGTVVWWDDKPVIFTAKHITALLEDKTDFLVVVSVDFMTESGYIVYEDDFVDFAVVEIRPHVLFEEKWKQKAIRRVGNVEVGDMVVHSGVGGHNGNLSFGIVSSPLIQFDRQNYVDLSGAPGSSGGGLFHADTSIYCGMVTAQETTGAGRMSALGWGEIQRALTEWERKKLR